MEPQTLGLGNESQLHDEQIVIDALAEKFCPGILYGHQDPAASGGTEGRWQSRRLVCTKERLYFFREGVNKILDLIPLVEIDKIERVIAHGMAAHVRDMWVHHHHHHHHHHQARSNRQTTGENSDGEPSDHRHHKHRRVMSVLRRTGAVADGIMHDAVFLCVAERVCAVYWRVVRADADAQQAQKSIIKCIRSTIKSRAILRAIT